MTTTVETNADLLLRVSNLKVSFRTDEGIIRVVDGIDFEVRRGQTLGIVGESGSGKSVSTKAIIQLLPDTAIIDPASVVELHRPAGEVVRIDELKPDSREIRRIRGGDISMIFQEPMASFSPVYTIGNQIMETVINHRQVSRKEAREIAIDMLDRVGIANPQLRVDQFPFELSGGMRQRAMIAVALASRPSLLIADEPTTALDVTIQAQILELMNALKVEFDMAIIFITHDLGVISQIADEVAVLYLGKIMEYGPTRTVIKKAQHPYTRRLLRAIPRLDQLGARLLAVGGDIPSPLERPGGCPFHTRCAEAIPGKCDRREPAVTHFDDRHWVSCVLYE